LLPKCEIHPILVEQTATGAAAKFSQVQDVEGHPSAVTLLPGSLLVEGKAE
jgi:hypothetical protein